MIFRFSTINFFQEALKKKQQLPTTPSSHCNALSMTSAATPTTNHMSPLVSHADFNQAEVSIFQIS